MSDSTNKRPRDGEEGDVSENLKKVKKEEKGELKNVLDLNEEESDPDDEEYDLGEEDDYEDEDEDEQLADDSELFDEEDEELDEEDEEDEESLPEEITIEVSGYNPTEDDFHGIKCLLQRLWLKENVDLSELTDILIKETTSTVFKQEIDDDDDEEEDEKSKGGDKEAREVDEDADTVLGVLALISFAHLGEKKCIKQIREVLLSHLPKKSGIAEKLCADDNKCALVVHERFLNLNPKLSIPAYNKLVAEIKENSSAADEAKKYDFDYVILVSKLATDDEETIYSNPEEELFCNEAEESFEYSVDDQCDPDLQTDWNNSGKIYKPFRKVILMRKDKWLNTIATLADQV